MRNRILKERIEQFVNEIALKLNNNCDGDCRKFDHNCDNYEKKDLLRDNNNLPTCSLHPNNNIFLFTDAHSDPQNSLLIIATYKEILSLLIRHIQNKNWLFVYAYIYLLYNLKSEIRISINLDKLEFIKMSLRGANEKSYALINKMLEMKKFVIVEEYKEFEIEIEYNRIIDNM